MSATTEIVEIKHWAHDAVLFSCKVKSGLPAGAKLGAAVRLAVKAGASLDGAILNGARLDGADLVGANLACANLAGASLAGANLARASLVGARLARARLARARLVDASLVDASLAGASGILDCGSPHGWRVVAVKHKRGIRIGAGCRWFKYRAAVDHWTGRADRKLMLPLLAYIHAAAEINGWKLED